MATAYTDTINGQPLTIVIDAVAWAEPVAMGWFARCLKLNRLLGDSTHLLHIPAVDDSEPIWYAGVTGTSLAAGIERMAIEHEPLRESIVAFPLDSRIYVARVEQGLVREEWFLYPDAFETHVQTWREQGRPFVLLTGDGRQNAEMPNAIEIPVDIDTQAMAFKHASFALLAARLLRWRDCIATLSIGVFAVGLSFAFAWWQRAPTVEPLQRVTALVTQPTSPVRHTASAELAKLVEIAAEHDPVLWHVHHATELKYDPSTGTVELHLADADPVSTHIGPLPSAPTVPELLPYTIHEFHTLLAVHLESPTWRVAFGDPYPVANSEDLEQHVTVSIGNVERPFETSVTAALIDLSKRLMRVPITMHQADCSILEGWFTSCELKLAIRGAAA